MLKASIASRDTLVKNPCRGERKRLRRLPRSRQSDAMGKAIL
jgi:hypothetical protein